MHLLIVTWLHSSTTFHFLAWRVVMAFKGVQNALWHPKPWNNGLMSPFQPPYTKLCCTALSDAPSCLSPPFLPITQLLVGYCSSLSHTLAQGHTPPGIKGQFKVRTSRKSLRNFSSPVFTGLKFQLHPPSCKLLQTRGFASAGLPIS